MNVDVAIGVVMAVGLVGTVVPFVPGLPLITLAAFVWVLADGADAGQWWVFAAVAVIAVAGMIAGSLLPAQRASAAGASRWALVCGAVGAVVGAFVIPVVGVVIGWPVGVLIAEWIRLRDVGGAWASTRATIIGMVHGTAIQLAAGVAGVVVWGIAAARW